MLTRDRPCHVAVWNGTEGPVHGRSRDTCLARRVTNTSNALAGRQTSGMAGCVIPSASREGYHTTARGQSCIRRPPVGLRAALGPPRGRALPGRRDDARAQAWLRSSSEANKPRAPVTRPEAHEQGHAVQAARTGTGRQWPSDRIRVHREHFGVDARPFEVCRRWSKPGVNTVVPTVTRQHGVKHEAAAQASCPGIALGHIGGTRQRALTGTGRNSPA